MIQIIKYNPGYKDIWNSFNAQAKNGHFLFHRDYLEYHQDRFKDHSLLFYKGKQLVALLPMNEKDDVVFSHGGLTFGGLLTNARIDIYSYLEVFDALLNYFKEKNFTKLIYKPVPFIFHQQLALEDQYALFRHKAILQSRSLSSCIELNKKIKYTKGRKWALKRAKYAGTTLSESVDFTAFMELVKNTLNTKYGLNPAHTAAEITYLASKFSENIKLIAVFEEQEMIGGTIIYIHPEVVHLQYIGLSETGKKLNALDLIIDYLIRIYQHEKKYLNFGISPGDDKFGLNSGLIQNKESYGARSLPHDIYEIIL